MDKKQIELALIERSNVISQLAEINAGYDAMKYRILTPELQKELDDIEAERDIATAFANTKLEELETQIRVSVVALGESVKAEGYGHAVFVNGRKTWDTKSLEKRMKEPEYSWLKNYLDIGEPSCTIRKA